ncbi:MAG: DUF4423 domain-containing protein [Bdellovibrionota bacterium]
MKIQLPRSIEGSINRDVPKDSFYQHCLKQELAKRCEKNARYSIRAFARSMRVDPGALSRVLSGKQIPSYKLAQNFLDRIILPPEDRQLFLSSIAEKQRSRGLKKLNPIFNGIEQCRIYKVEVDTYRLISEWYHAAILTLSYTQGFENDTRWISKQLGISVTEAKLAVERLLEAGLLVENSGRLEISHQQLTTKDKSVTTPALRRHQKQLLEKAIASLESDPIDERNMTSMTMAIDPEKLPLAKKLISEFNKSLCQLLESGDKKRVYNLAVALYPLQGAEENI